MTKTTKHGEILCPYPLHDSLMVGHSYSLDEKTITFSFRTELEKKPFALLVDSVELLKAELWEAHIVFAFFRFNIDNLTPDYYHLRAAMEHLFQSSQYNKNLETLSAYNRKSLFYMESSYGGKIAFIGGEIYFDGSP